MKKIMLLLAATALIAACNSEKKTEETKPPVALPYVASYSSSFEIGNAEYAATILQGSWKDWEENKLDNMKNWVADSIVAYNSDNTESNGLDSMMARWKKGRAELSAATTTIDAVIPVYSTDKKENWVLVWATEVDTKKDGTVDTVRIMETWRINKDGKADMLFQFDRAKRKK